MEMNKIFAFFLKKKGINPMMKRTAYGFRTYDGKWKLFIKSMSIMHTKRTKVYNGCDYDNAIEESKYQIVQREGAIDLVFTYTRII